MNPKKMNKKKENAKRVRDLEAQIESFKKGIKTRNMVINDLKMDVAANYEMQRLLSAYIAVLIDDMGGSVRINKDKISAKIGKYNAKIEEDGNEYVIEIEKISEKVGEE